jgi:hypothetical protein
LCSSSFVALLPPSVVALLSPVQTAVAATD